MKTFVLGVFLLTAGGLFSAYEPIASLQGMATLGGSSFPGVEVEASSSSIGQFWETSTNSTGRYAFDQLPPGRYTVWAEATGHGCIVKTGITVKEGASTTQDFRFAKNKKYPGCESLKPKKR